MGHESLRIELGGSEVPELYEDLVELEIELDEELAGMFRFTIALRLQADGNWTYLDDDRFVLWQKVTVVAGPQDAAEQLIVGYVTHLRPEFKTGLDQCRLQVWGMDSSVLLDRDDVLKDWPNKKDSDIAEETFRAHGLDPVITDTQVIHDEEVSTIVQRETDMQFLRRLALRNGFECFVDGDKGYFRPPVLDGGGQPVLAVQFGDKTNVSRFGLDADALRPSGVSMTQVDRVSGELLQVQATPGEEQQLGSTGLDSFLGAGMSPGAVVLDRVVTTGSPEMTALCQGLLDTGEWFVTGEGEADASQYPAVLKPRATVVVKGIGRTHSGTYYVTRVTHRFTADGYQQQFGVKRNALRPTGSEDFSGGGGGLLGAVGL
jgi:phage protein D